MQKKNISITGISFSESNRFQASFPLVFFCFSDIWISEKQLEILKAEIKNLIP
jgi:hypothetical protein